MHDPVRYEHSTPEGKLYRPTPPEPMIIAEGTIDNFGKWSLDENGLLTIDGKGSMPRWEALTYGRWTPWHRFRDRIRTVYMAQGITSIGCDAFFDCTALTGITIPTGVTLIDEHAFHGCTSLPCICIPSSVDYIATMAFCNCETLTEITVPESVTTLERDVFFGCHRLQRVYMPTRFDRIFFYTYHGIEKSIVTFT